MLLIPPVTGSVGEVWYNTEEEKLYFTYDINSWSEILKKMKIILLEVVILDTEVLL